MSSSSINTSSTIHFTRTHPFSPHSLYRVLFDVFTSMGNEIGTVKGSNGASSELGKVSNVQSQPIISQRLYNELSRLLSYYKAIFLHSMLKFPENNATELQKLMQDQIEGEHQQDAGPAAASEASAKYSPQFKQFVAQLAQHLKLSESLTLNLILQAQQSHPDRFIYDAWNTSVMVYFEERENLLLSLLTLLQGRRAENVPQRLKHMTHEYVCELMRETPSSGGLVKVLTDAIRETNRLIQSGQVSGGPGTGSGAQQQASVGAQSQPPQFSFGPGNNTSAAGHNRTSTGDNTIPNTTPSASSAPLTDYYILERQRLVECLFFAVYDFNVSPKEVDCIGRTLAQCLDLLKALRPQPQTTEDDAPAYQALCKVVYLLVFTLQSALDPFSSKYGKQPDQRPTKNTLYHGDNTALKEVESYGRTMDKFIDSLNDSSNDLVRSIYGFLVLHWSLCLETISKRFEEESSSTGTFTTFRDLASKRFDEALERNVFTWISDELLTFSPLFEEDETLSEFCVHIVSDLAISLIEHMSWKLEAIQEYQTSAIRHQTPLPHARYHRVTEKFMKFVSSIYYTNSQHASHFLYSCYNFLVKDMPQFFQSMSLPSEGVHTYSFVSYIQLLSALSKNADCAREVFRMLKEPLNTTFEWNSFFNVIKQFRYQTQATQSRGSHAIVEVILDLISNVAENFPASRPLFIQSSQWDILDSLFGFADQPKISTELMGKVFTTVASFVYDQSVAFNVWNRLEHHQVLVTQRQSIISGGIRHQFTKVETSDKYYPETIGFLKLLAKLIHYVIPADLGIETRADVPPGVAPHLDFVLKVVFNHFDAREYNVEAQKWEITSICLSIFHDILHNYTIQAVDFQNQSVNVQTEGSTQGGPRMRTIMRDSHPGFQLMLSLLNLEDQSFTKNLLKIVCKHSTIKSLEENRYASQQQQSFYGSQKPHSIARHQSQGSSLLEKSILYSLKILTIMLERQDEFRGQGAGQARLQQAKLRPPEDLIKGDHIVRIAEFIAYSHLADIRLYAVKLLALVSQINRHVVDVFINAQMHHHLMSMIISRLRGDTFDSVYTTSQVAEEDVRNAILDLLLLNAEAPSPNLTHYLCGVESKWSASQPSSTRVTIRTDDGHCLFAILQLLSDRSSQRAHSRLVLKCYQLIYRLCSDKKICTAVLQYLERTNFFSIHLLNQHKWTARNQSHQEKVNRLHQRAFILKIFALQIYVSTTHLTPGARVLGGEFTDDQLGTVRKLVHILFQHSSYATRTQQSSTSMEQDRAQILEMLHTIDLTPISKPPLIQISSQYPSVSTDDCIVEVQVDYIDSPLATSALAAASNMSRITVKFYDIQKLHSRLMDAKLNHQRTQGNVDTVAVDREIERILELAVRWNEYFQHLSAISHAFYGWSQVVGVAISKCYNMLSEDKRALIVYDLLNTLLFKLITEDTVPAIRSSIASVVLRLTAKLREQCIQSVARLRLPTDQCLNLLRTLMETILLDTLTPATRGNLYASLLNYLQYTKVSDHALPFYKIHTNRDHLTRQYADLMHDFERQQDIFMKNQLLLDSKHQQLIERIAKDAIGQRGAWKTTAFSTLDLLMSYDIKGKWVKYFEQNHQINLSVILQQYALLEKPLIDILKGDQTSLNSLYILESMSSFLIRICHSRHLKRDARYRILFSVCDRCKFIDWIPPRAFKVGTGDTRGETSELSMTIMDDGSTMRDIYHQVLIPVLQILTALFTQEYDNEKIARQVLQFIITYSKTIASILKQTKQSLTKHALQEQRLITTLFHLLSMKHHQLMWSMLKDHYSKFEVLMKSLLVEMLDIYKQETPLRSYGKSDQEVEVCILDICRNVTGLLRQMCQSSDEIDITLPTQILFSVEMRDRPMRNHSIDGLVSLIDVFTRQLQSLDEKIRANDEQIAQLDNLGTQDLMNIAETDASSPGMKYALMGIQENREHIRLIVQSLINQRLSNLTARVTKTLYILENALLVLWLHLNYFLQQNRSGDNDSMQDEGFTSSRVSMNLAQLSQRSSQLLRGTVGPHAAQNSSIFPIGEHRQNFVVKMNNQLRQPLDVLIEYQRAQKTHSLLQSSEFLSFMAYRVSSQLYQGQGRQ